MLCCEIHVMLALIAQTRTLTTDNAILARPPLKASLQQAAKEIDICTEVTQRCHEKQKGISIQHVHVKEHRIQ